MRESLVGLLEKAEMAIGTASGTVERLILESLGESVRLMRTRLDSPDDLLIVGVAGGTGSGKSSLLNALAGDELAEVGGIRPTTGRPLGVASAGTLGAVAPYLRAIGVDSTATAELGDWLCLIDLPDTDSAETDHRQTVERLLPRVDAVVWVVDPEKYRDASLHHGFIRPLASYGQRFVFAFNQIDRVRLEARARVLGDFEQALHEDGLGEPLVVATAADPTAGPPLGTGQLLIALKQMHAHGVLESVLIGLEDAARRLLAAVGSGGLDFARRADVCLGEATDLVLEGDPEGATDRLSGFLDEIAAEAGGVAGERVKRISAAVPAVVQSALDRAHHENQVESVSRSLDSGLMAPVRDILRVRAETLAVATDLLLSSGSLRSARQP